MGFNVGNFIREHATAGYNTLDGKLGGVLPGGTGHNFEGLARDVARDALPGRRIHGETMAEKAAGTAGDLASGRVDLAATRSRAGAATGALREHAVEEGVEAIGRRAVNRIARRGGFYAVPVVGQGMAVADTVKDGMDAFDAVVQVNTGKGFGTHVDETMQMRNQGRGLGALIPDGSYVGEGDHQLNQGSHRAENAILREVKNRATRFGQKFRPHKGDLGCSEVMGWN